MNAKQLTMHPNKLECSAYAILDTIGIPYEKQHVIGNKFCVDAFIPSLSLVVQFDGDYWHGLPEKFPEPSERQQKRMRLDVSQDAYMAACGYRVIRIWEKDIKNRPEHVTDLLRNALAQP
jgi:very-short-patch-repair endonuclease